MRRLVVCLAITIGALVLVGGCDLLAGIGSRPNLWVEEVLPVFVEGEFAGAEVRVRNDGAAAEDVSFVLVLSEDEIADYTDTRIYESSFDIDSESSRTLLVGRVPHIEPFLFRTHTGVGPGDYHVGVILDDIDDVEETDESDNTSVAQTPLVPGIMATNLVVDRLELQFGPETFDAVEIQFRNEGAAAFGTQYAVYLSSDRTIDASDIVVYESVVDLHFMQQITVRVDRAQDIEPFLGAGVSIPPGEYFVGVTVDPSGEVAESDESDNSEVSLESLPVGTEGGIGPDSFETNESFTEWKSFPQGMENWQPATLHHGNDHDWYEVHQMMDMSLYIDLRKGPNGMDVPVMVEVFSYDDPGMVSPLYVDGPFTDHFIYADMTWAPGIDQWWRVHVWSPAGETGEYEIQAYDY